MSDTEYWKLFRRAQDGAAKFFKETDGLMHNTDGTGALINDAAKDFVIAAQPLFSKHYPLFILNTLIDTKAPLSNTPLEKGTLALIQFLQTQDFKLVERDDEPNTYITPASAEAFGRAIAQALTDLALHQEKASEGHRLTVTGITPIFE